MNPNFRNFALWVIIILLVVALVMLFQNPGQRVPSQDIAFSQLLNEVDQGHVREVTISGNEITGHFTDNRAFATYVPNDPTLVQNLYKKNVSILATPSSGSTNWLITLLVNALPLIAALLVLFTLIRGGSEYLSNVLMWRIGVGAVVILPLAAPILRPLAKTAIKGG